MFVPQVLLLVAGRWLVGWIFPAKDLEILDDPIPEKLYCGRRCTPDKVSSSNGCCNNNSDDSSDLEKGLEMKDDIDGKHLEENASRKSSNDKPINITREMNNCDLWKHMVGSMDRNKQQQQQQQQPAGDQSASSQRRSSVKTNLLSKFDEADDGGFEVSEKGKEGSAWFKSTEV